MTTITSSTSTTSSTSQTNLFTSVFHVMIYHNIMYPKNIPSRLTNVLAGVFMTITINIIHCHHLHHRQTFKPTSSPAGSKYTSGITSPSPWWGRPFITLCKPVHRPFWWRTSVSGQMRSRSDARRCSRSVLWKRPYLDYVQKVKETSFLSDWTGTGTGGTAQAGCKLLMGTPFQLCLLPKTFPFKWDHCRGRRPPRKIGRAYFEF